MLYIQALKYPRKYILKFIMCTLISLENIFIMLKLIIRMLYHFISWMKNVMTINIHNYICFLLSKYLVMPIDDEVSKFGLGINFMVLWQNHGSCVICTLQYNLWYKSKKWWWKLCLDNALIIKIVWVFQFRNLS